MDPEDRKEWEEVYARKTSENYPIDDRFIITIVSSAVDEHELKEQI